MGKARTTAVPGSVWSVRADALFCLKLLLPSRKEVAEPPFLAELRETVRYAIYRATAAPDPVPCAATGGMPAPPGPPLVRIAAAGHAGCRTPRLSAIFRVAAAPDPHSTDEPESDA